MSYSERFKDSAALNPNGGFRMSPAACGFILAEMEGLVQKYEDELAKGDMAPQLTRMVEHHLEGLRYLTAEIKAGMTNRG